MSTTPRKAGDLPADSADAVLRFAANARRAQTSAKFLADAALAGCNLRYLLDAAKVTRAPTPEQVAAVGCLVRDASIKAYSYKILNTVTFWPAAALAAAGALWPVQNHFLTKLDATMSGLIQTALVTTAGALFAVYQQFKRRQMRIEDALRRTLFTREEIDEKVKRLVDLPTTLDTGVAVPGSGDGDGTAAEKPGREAAEIKS